MRKLLYGAVQFTFSGIITLLMIPAGGIFLMIRIIWKIMDNILSIIDSPGAKQP